MAIKYTKFKNNNMIELVVGNERRPFTFGVSKALEICAHVDDLVEFWKADRGSETFGMVVGKKPWQLTRNQVKLILGAEHLDAIINFAAKHQRGNHG